MFPVTQRGFLLLVISPEENQPLVARYRNPAQLRAAIPHSDLIPRLPRLPFIGETSYLKLVRILKQQRQWFSRAEKMLVDQLTEYLEMKQATRPRSMTHNQDTAALQSREDSGG